MREIKRRQYKTEDIDQREPKPEHRPVRESKKKGGFEGAGLGFAGDDEQSKFMNAMYYADQSLGSFIDSANSPKAISSKSVRG